MKDEPTTTEEKQKAALGQEDFYKARLIFNVKLEPEVTISVRVAESLRDEMREFCKQQGIQQTYFISEAIKEVLFRVKKELADAQGQEAGTPTAGS